MRRIAGRIPSVVTTRAANNQTTASLCPLRRSTSSLPARLLSLKLGHGYYYYDPHPSRRLSLFLSTRTLSSSCIASTSTHISTRRISSSPPPSLSPGEVSEGILVDKLSPDRQVRVLNLETQYRKFVFQHGEVHSSSIEALTQIGDTFWEFNELESAQTTYEQALHNLWDLHGGMRIEHPRIASILHKLGSVHARKGSLDEAMKWYEKALVMKQKVYSKSTKTSDGGGGDSEPPCDSEVGLTLNGIAMIHAERGELQQAVLKFQEASSATRHGTSLGDDHPHVGSICENLGLLYMQGEDYKAALVQFEEALRIIQLPSSEHGADSEYAVSLLMKMGECYYELNDNNRAKEINEEALRIVTKVLKEPEGPMAAVLRHNMGLVNAKLGLLDEALDSLEQSWELKKQLVGSEDHPECASTLNAMGAVYGTKQELHKALSFFREALRIYQVTEPFDEEGNDHPNIVNTKRNIALVEGASSR